MVRKSLLEELVFDDLQPIEIPVRIAGKQYVLREASTDAATKYRNAVLKSTRLDRDGHAMSLDGSADVEPLLVSMCLFEVNDKGETLNRPVNVSVVKTFPSKVTKELYDRVRAISGLGAEDTEEELEKEIKDLQERLEELREKKLKEAVQGNS